MAGRSCESCGVPWRLVLLVGVVAALALTSYVNQADSELQAPTPDSVQQVRGGALPALQIVPSQRPQTLEQRTRSEEARDDEKTSEPAGSLRARRPHALH